MRVLATILHSDYAKDFKSQTDDLTEWITEIVEASFAQQKVRSSLPSPSTSLTRALRSRTGSSPTTLTVRPFQTPPPPLSWRPFRTASLNSPSEPRPSPPPSEPASPSTLPSPPRQRSSLPSSTPSRTPTKGPIPRKAKRSSSSWRRPGGIGSSLGPRGATPRRVGRRWPSRAGGGERCRAGLAWRGSLWGFCCCSRGRGGGYPYTRRRTLFVVPLPFLVFIVKLVHIRNRLRSSKRGARDACEETAPPACSALFHSLHLWAPSPVVPEHELATSHSSHLAREQAPPLHLTAQLLCLPSSARPPRLPLPPFRLVPHATPVKLRAARSAWRRVKRGCDEGWS